MTGEKSAKRRLTGGIVAVAVLALCLCITTLALVYSMVSVEGNLFQTGRIEINLNDGNPVIEEDEFLFEPGATVEKNFFIENTGTWDVYYKVYMENLEGGLAMCWRCPFEMEILFYIAEQLLILQGKIQLLPWGASNWGNVEN